MNSLISHLTEQEQENLMNDLNYLNMEEIQFFCQKHSIPYRITYEDCHGKKRSTNDKDRKGIALDRVRHFLKTGSILAETCFHKDVVGLEMNKPSSPNKNDKLYYGYFDRNYIGMYSALKDLTNGKFKDGAIARILIREYWTKGLAPTYAEYAVAWVDAVKKHKLPRPEWAFLTDLSRGSNTRDWKAVRQAKAIAVMEVLAKIQDIIP